MTPFRLKMNGPGGQERILLYSAFNSSLVWEDNGQKVDFSMIGMNFPSVPRQKGVEAFPVAPWNPAGKTTALKKIKIQLGLKCNYSCSYCNQGGQTNLVQGRISDVELFMQEIPSWFDGGIDGRGKGVVFEFWGGEPLVYYKVLKPLAEAVRTKYPNSRFNLISNLSLLTKDISDWLNQMGFGVGMSHDGPGYEKARGTDPLKNPEQLQNIRYLYDLLSPQNRIGFNCVLTKENRSLFQIRKYIAEKLGVAFDAVNLTTEEILLPYSEGGMALSPQSAGEHNEMLQQFFWEGVMGQSMATSTLKSKCEDFFQSIAQARPASELGQKCGMDRSDNIAVNLKGDVMTCQNTSAEGMHKIGSVKDFGGIKLTTATHWSHREECKNCPVLQMCQGACLFLEGPMWTQGCDNSFTWNLSVLAISLYWLTRMVLVEIEAPIIRRASLPSTLKVIDINEDVIRLRTGRKFATTPVVQSEGARA